MGVHDVLRRVLRRGHRKPPRPALPNGLPARLEADKPALSSFVLYLTGIVGCSTYPLDELMLMGAAFMHHRPDLVVDIGTQYGRSARIWHELTAWLGTSTEIHTIDLCDPVHCECPAADLGIMFRGLPVTQHIGDGYSCARRILEQYPGAKTLLYLDGDHRYETVAQELALTALISSGCLLAHDTFYQPGSAYNHGPYEAICSWLKGRPATQIVRVQTGPPGMSYVQLVSQ